MANDTPTIALVHGAFAESASWRTVIERLHQPAAGVERPFGRVVAIGNPLRSLTGDAAYVRDVVLAIDGPVVLVAHSYGGMVATQAAAGLDAVRALVYVGAFAPDRGESAFTLSTRFPGSTLGAALDAYPVSTGGNELAIRPDVFHEQFCADVPPQEAASMAATQRPATEIALSEALSADRPAWADTPSWFVFGEQDRNIPAELSRWMADRAGSRRTVELSGASHALSVSRPDEVAALVMEAVTTTAPAPTGAR